MKTPTKILFIILGFLFVLPAKSQQNADVFNTYNRSGLTWVYIKNSEQKYSHEIENAFQKTTFNSSGKYDDNQIENKILSVNGKPQFTEILQKNKIPNVVVDSLFLEKDGKWSYEKLLYRAKYTMTDADRRQFEASFAGVEVSADRKWAEKILKSNYIIAFDINNIGRYKDYYDEIDADRRKKSRSSNSYEFKPVTRIFKGYYGNLNASIYRIELNDSVLAVMYENCWADENSKPEVLANAQNFRKNMYYKLIKVSNSNFEIQGRTLIAESDKSKEEYFAMMLSDKTVSKILEDIETKVETFQVKAPIFSRRPLEVKIGKKEGVKTNGRYIVFEQQMKDGKIITVRRGVIRATHKITDNYGIASGETKPTKFYQVQGRKLDVGMLVKQEKDFFGIQLGGGTHGFYAKVDAFLPAKSISGVKAYVDFNFTTKSFDIEEITINDTEYDTGVLISGFGLGVSKEMYFLKNLFLAPYAGLQFEYASFSDVDFKTDWKDDEFTINDEAYSDYYGLSMPSFNAGLQFGVTVAHKVKFIASGGFSPISFDSHAIFGDSKDNEYNLHIERPSTKLNFTLRYEL